MRWNKNMTSKREVLDVPLCLTRKNFPSLVILTYVNLSHFILLYLVLQITGSTSENHPSSDNSAADNPRNRSTSENQPPSDNSAADNQRNRSTQGNLAKDDNSAADHAFEVSSCVVPVVEDETDDDLLLSAECCSTSVDVEEIQGEQGDKTAKRKNTKKMEEVQSERRSKRKRGAKRF